MHSRLSQKIDILEPASVKNTIPVQWRKAKGCIIYGEKGRKWIDFTSGIFVTNAGHSNEKIKKAIQKQLNSDLLFSYNYPTQIKYEFLNKLLSVSKHFDSAALLATGSEATDLAYKLIKIWAKKNKKKYIVSFKGSYHGRGLSCDLISGNKDKANWSGLADGDVVFLDFPYTHDATFDSSKLPPPQEIAAFFLETFQGWGAWFYPDQYISDLYTFAKRSGSLICFDEMQSGFFRLGALYGYMTYGQNIVPDLICVGKGISSSLPLSAVLSKKEIFDIDATADLHGTHSANSLCCAAALANLEFLSSRPFQKRLNVVSKYFIKELMEIKNIPVIRRVNARGMVAALIFERADTATAIVNKCVQKGLLPVCTNKNSIKLAPPLTITIPTLKKAFSILRECIQEDSTI